MSSPSRRGTAFDWMVERCLPHNHETLSNEKQQQARLLASALLLLNPSGLLFALFYVLSDELIRGGLILGCTGLAAIALPLLRYRGIFWATQWWIGVFFVALVGVAVWGHASTVPPWMGMLVLLASLFSGARVGLYWGAGMLLVFLVLFVAEHQGVLPLVQIPPRLGVVIELCGMSFFFVANLVIGVNFSRTQSRAMQQLAEARDAARRASDAKSNFLATMSHEIRTPMNGILGLTTLLEATELDGEQRALVRTLRSSSGALVGIISDILDFSKIEAGRMELERIPVSPCELIEDVVALFEPAADHKGLRLTGRTDPGLPDWIWSDPTRLRQVLTNLVSNAVKFTASGTIEVRACQAGAGAFRLEVIDTGAGIPREQQAVLFQPFTQAESSTTRRYGGTGLGLTICRRLAELMGGRIGVDSDGHAGSCFWVVLPCEPAPAAEQPRLQAPAAAARHLVGRVLLVEDHAVNQLVASRMLQGFGLDVQIASDGREALAALEGDRFALVLMDCQMPGMDGYTATREIRRTGCSLPIIALTADVTEDAREQARAAGMDGYLPKPISREALQRVLQSHLPSPAQ